MEFIETRMEEDPSKHTRFILFYTEFIEFLKEKRLRPMTKIMVGKALKNEGFQVKGRRTEDENGEEIQTTCVFGVKFSI
ncbi:MAG: hypothetical protein IID63_05470 [candidate division Zixibacteria bacterium]|nr:hypothetical protein [candidate division Zixibacteria bacterium]